MNGTVADVEETVIYPPRVKLLAFALACAAVAGLGFALAAVAAPVLAVTAGLVGVATGAGAVVLMWRALRPGPSLRVCAEGIVDRTGLSPVGLVRWEEIAAIRKREIGRGRGAERLLELVLIDPEEFSARPRSAARRVADRYRRVLKHPPVAIPGSMVSRPLGEVVDEVHRRRPELPVMELPPPLPGLFGRRPDRGPQTSRW